MDDPTQRILDAIARANAALDADDSAAFFAELDGTCERVDEITGSDTLLDAEFVG